MRTEVQLGFPEELFDVQMCVGELTQVGTALMKAFSRKKGVCQLSVEVASS